MSTLNVESISHPTSGSNVTINGVTPASTNSLGLRNLIINGAMQVAQRGTSHSLAHDGTTGAYTTDRFVVAMSGADQWDCTVTQSSTAPDGYANSLLVTTGTAETTIDADEYMSVQYKVEAQDLQHIASGTAAAKAMTLSFWVRSSQTGTFAFAIYKGDNTGRGISATYTISSANTWEYKTIAIPGDTSGGGIANDNGNGWNMYWLLAAGSNFTSTDSTSWINYVSTGLAYGHTQNGVVTNGGATWQITGVQLEVGQVATPFEHRSYGDELRRCQRYYQISTRSIGAWTGSSRFRILEHFGTPMRAAPTTTLLDTAIYHEYWAQVGYSTLSSIHSATSRIESADVSVNSASASGRSQNQFAMIENGAFGFSAEL